MNSLKSQFVFNAQQRLGILLLAILIAASLGVYHFYSFGKGRVLDISSPEIIALQTHIDSLRTAEAEARKPKQYPFNPNFITDYKAYTLGMSPREFDRLKLYRSKDQWINSVADFKKVTKVSDSLMDIISPLFKFPEWITNPKPKTQKISNEFSEKSYSAKTDLNIATAEQLQQVSGIGEALSSRIVNYREQLGGFVSDLQLYNVYGLKEDVVKRTLNLFTVKTPKELIKLDLNTSSASDIATIPGISFDLAKEIWEFRILRERIEDFSELEKIEGLTASKIALIQLYLSID